MRHHLLMGLFLALASCGFGPIRATAGPGSDEPCMNNSDCAGIPSTPACDTTRNVCVPCFGPDNFGCTGTMPICTNEQCGPCTQHTDCKASTVCLSDGSCASDAQVAYVDSIGNDNSDCSKANPCKKVTVTLATKRPYVKLHGNIDESVSINGQTVTLLADPGTTLTRSGTGAILQIMGTSTVEIDDLQISGGTGMNNPGISIPGGSNVTLLLKRAKISGTKDNGITCSSGSVTLEAATISDNQGTGINCFSASLTISRSTIASNQASGINVSGGLLTVSRSTISGNQSGGIATIGTATTFNITNNFIYRNGNPITANVGGASLIPSIGGSTPSRFEFNTVVDNQVKDSAILAGGVLCDQAGFVSPNNIIARNSVNNDATRTNANTAGLCQYPTSAVASGVSPLKFRSPDNSPYDYHILPGSSAIRQATTPSTITIDFDNDPRPSSAGDQGADQYKP